MSKRVLIIGGGISGLTAGVYAAKAGYETHLYEQQAYVGGECTGWDRGGYHIDNCIHWMNGTAPGIPSIACGRISGRWGLKQRSSILTGCTPLSWGRGDYALEGYRPDGERTFGTVP